MSALLERMREGRKSPQVLKIRLIAIRSSRPESIVVFFEGPDDVPVYEEWFARTPARPTYEPVAGNGKEQLLALQLLLEQDKQLGGVYFVVDHDYDENFPLANVYVLDAYSIENVLCNSQAAESLIIDELRCAGDPVTRENLLALFSRFLEKFTAATYELHEMMFVARREGLRVEKKPEHARDFTSIEFDNAEKRYGLLEEIFTISAALSPERTRRHRAEFSALPMKRTVRGKYLMQAFRMWVKLLAEDRRSHQPACFPDSIARLPGAPENFSLRRLASRTPIPEGLADYAQAMRRTYP